MTTPVQPQYDPEFWRQYMLNAIAAYHADPNDLEAKDAIQDAVRALNAMDQPLPDPNFGQSLIGGLKGVGVNLPINTVAGLTDVLSSQVSPSDLSASGFSPFGINPEAGGKLLSGLYNTLRGPDRTIRRAVTEGNVTPEQASEAFGGAAAAVLPFFKSAPTPAPIRALTKPFNAVGAMFDRPVIRNAEMEAQQRLSITRQQAAAQAARHARATAQRAAAAGPVQQAILETRLELMQRQLEAAQRRGGGPAGSTTPPQSPSGGSPSGAGPTAPGQPPIPDAEFTVENAAPNPAPVVQPNALPAQPRGLLGNVAEPAAPDITDLSKTPPFDLSAANPAAQAAHIANIIAKMLREGKL